MKDKMEYEKIKENWFLWLMFWIMGILIGIFLVKCGGLFSKVGCF